MPADEVTHGTDVDASRVRTGPRHAAPKKPLFTRFHMPAGKAIASVAMPTAVIMGMGFTSTLAIADTNNTSTSSNSQKADDYKDCVSALDSASPSASASDDAKDSATPSPSASSGAKDSSSDKGEGKSGDKGKDAGKSSSSDSGSDDVKTPTPSKSSSSGDSGSSGSDATATPSPSASATGAGGGLLGSIGDAISGILGGGTAGSSASDSAASPTPSASASAGGSSSTDTAQDDTAKDDTAKGDSASGTVKDTVTKAAKTVTDTVKDTTDKATEAAGEVTEDATGAAGDATATPSPSDSAAAVPDDCKVATDDVSGVDNKVAVADDPWYLSASSLLLKSADYQGVVEVKTASGKTKKVLKYVISGGTDIGDLHQTVKDTTIGKTYHVQARSGSTSTIRDGDTTMYTESISGNLFGLIPITFTPDSPPPLNIPLIYFTNVKVVQAAQFGGTLHVPGMHVYTTDGTG
ncbi:hypothetical protein [Streptomyces sp. NPDC090080]|uniref:hypothetical protein n=1 Tax=Streptomyces sp. NPDC090080 TaxID=3365939 RepID=UPI00381CFF84